MKWLYNLLFGYEKRAVDEIMRPLTRIHDALHARSENAKLDGINAHQRALNFLDEAGQHR